MVKNYASSSRLDISEATEKTRIKVGILTPLGLGGVLHQFRGFLPVTLEVIKVHS